MKTWYIVKRYTYHQNSVSRSSAQVKLPFFGEHWVIAFRPCETSWSPHLNCLNVRMSKCPLFKHLNPWKLSHHAVRNVDNWLPTDTASYVRRKTSSATPLWHRAVLWRIWTEWLNEGSLSLESILGMGSETIFPKDSKRLSRGTSSLLPCAVIILSYLIYSKRHSTILEAHYTELWDWNNWFLLKLNWLVPTETELTGSYWDWTDWFLLQLNWLVPTTTERTGS